MILAEEDSEKKLKDPKAPKCREVSLPVRQWLTQNGDPRDTMLWIT